MVCNIEAIKLELFNKTKQNTTATMGEYITINGLELGECNGKYKFKGNVIIKVDAENIVINNDYETDNAFKLRLSDCRINDSIYCNIEIDGLWLQSQIKKGYNIFETNADAYADIKIIE